MDSGAMPDSSTLMWPLFTKIGALFDLIGGPMIDSNDLLWLAGYLEAEGSFLKGPPSKPHGPRVMATSTDLDIIERVANLFGINYIHTRQHTHSVVWKPSYQTILGGSRAVSLMQALYPFMGLRRQHQIATSVASFQPSAPERFGD